MKIAFFLSAKNIVPPPMTGGVEYSAYYLIRELAWRGHQITPYAGFGSKISGVTIRPITDRRRIREQEYANWEERIINLYDQMALSRFFYYREWRRFDLIYYSNYLFYEILPFSRWVKGRPIVIRLNYPHNYLSLYIKDALRGLENVHFLPVSNFIKTSLPGLPYLNTVYPAIDFSDYSFSVQPEEYLFSIGRICPEKGTHLAIEAARQAGRKLVIAGPVSQSHYRYFQTMIKPNVDNKNIIYVGEIGFQEKVKIYKGALATLFPIQWNEPFGLVLVESMACGTPVIAFDRAAVREIVKDGQNGYVVRDGDIGAMAQAVAAVSKLDRQKVRQWSKKKFAIEKWADKFENICRQLIS